MANLTSGIRIRHWFDLGTLIDAVLLITYGCYFDRLAERTAKLMKLYRENKRSWHHEFNGTGYTCDLWKLSD